MDAGNMLKPMLARGELRMVGATTLDEFREHIEKDPALERRFQQVLVGEPTVEDTIAILRGLEGPLRGPPQGADRGQRARRRSRAERPLHHLTLPARQGHRPRSTRPPSRLRMEIDSSPVEIDELQRSVDRLKMEEMALAHETDEASTQRLARLRAELADRSEQLDALLARWEREKTGLNRVGDLKERIDDLRGQAERAQRDGDLETASRLMYVEIPAGERELAEAASTEAATDVMVAEEVTADDIAAVVAAWTGIPAGRLLEGETAKLLRMEDELGHRVIGQKQAVQAVSDAVRRARAGHQRPRPSDRLVPVPRPDRRRQDGAGQGAGRVPVRRRAGHGPHRHERVFPRSTRWPAWSGAARIRRLRRGRPADRGRSGAGRTRSCCSTRSRRPTRDVFDILLQVLDDGRLTDGQGRHRRLPQRDPGADVEPGFARAGRRSARRDQEGAVLDSRARALQARVPQPPRRHRRVRPADHGRAGPDRRHPDRRPGPPARLSAG